MADGLRGLPDDLASDDALCEVVAERRFAHASTSRFDLHSYFEGVEELANHLARNSRRYAPSPCQVKRWREACADSRAAGLRIREHMQLGVYWREELA